MSYVERNSQLRIGHADCSVTPQCVIPNDPLFVAQWYLQNDQRTVQPSLPYAAGADINAPLAWSQSLGGSGTKVAVIDTGIDEDHPDLAGRIDGLYSHVDNGGDVSDETGHGTFVAGLIAANWNNALGMGGIAPRARLIVVKASIGASTAISIDALASAIRVAADAGAEIINISSGSTTSSFALLEAVLYASSRGSLVVAAAGNNGTSTPTYPANTSFVLSVAATNNRDERASFSSFGPWVDMTAPGVAIVSTVPTYPTVNFGAQTHFAVASGTSFSAPLVSGTAALIWDSVAATSSAPEHQVPAQLLIAADRIPGTETYWKYGRLNACRALAYFTPNCPRQAPSPVPPPRSAPLPAATRPGIGGTYRRRLAPAINVVANSDNRLTRFIVRPVLNCGSRLRISRRVRMVTGRGITVAANGRVRLSVYVRTAGRLARLRVTVRGRFANNRLAGTLRATAVHRKTARRCATTTSWSIKRTA